MRSLVLFLAACAPCFAVTVSSFGTCDTPVSEIETSVSPVWVSVWVCAPPGESNSASVSLTEDYVLTVTGGSGDGLFQPELGGAGDHWGAQMVATATASVLNSAGDGCVSSSDYGMPWWAALNCYLVCRPI